MGYSATLESSGFDSIIEPVRSREDRAVWNEMRHRLGTASACSRWHSPIYRDAFAWFEKRERIPTLMEINDWLSPIGWQAIYVEGYVPVKRYQYLQSNRIFPVCRFLRKWRDLDHSAAPDFVHDVLGHLPMLFDERFNAVLQEWAVRGVMAEPTQTDLGVTQALCALIDAREKRSVDPEEVTACTDALVGIHKRALAEHSRHFLFETFYTWTMEFGVIDDGHNHPTLIGGAALSSPGEMARIFAGDAEFVPFARNAVGTPVDYTTYQRRIFVAHDYDEYFDALAQI